MGEPMKEYSLHLPNDVKRQLGKCRISIRKSIRQRLQEIVETAARAVSRRRKPSASLGPALRFYVYEGYRISYQVDPATRRIVVLELQAEPC